MRIPAPSWLPSVDGARWRQHATRNRLQAAALLAAMGAYLALLGWLLWGTEGALGLLGGLALGAVLSPGVSPRTVMRLHRARPLHPREAPGLQAILARLAERAGLPAVPQLYYVPSPMLNAFAAGRPDDAAVAVTDGLLRHLDAREAAGVLAHEISHVRGNDLGVMGLADVFSRVTNLLSLLGQLLLLVSVPLLVFEGQAVNLGAVLVLVLAPGLTTLAQLALARNREYDADLYAARLTGDPVGLARALERIERLQGGFWERLLRPRRGEPGPFWLRTHPETRARVARLLALRAEVPVVPELARLFAAPGRLDGLVRRVSYPSRWRASRFVP